MSATTPDAPPVSPAPIPPQIDPAEFKDRDDWFNRRPSPWEEIAVLQPGADRTHATTISDFVTRAEPAQWPALEEKLLAVLRRPEITDGGREFVCRMLGLIGSAACVAVVAPLLLEARSAHWARMALDGVADPAVDAAYRDALGRLRGRARAGLIGSIGARGDRQALPALEAIAADATESAEVRTVAERAMERLKN